jgi:hypothetical protein
MALAPDEVEEEARNEDPDELPMAENDSPDPSCIFYSQCYKTFYGRNFQMFVIS